jgi:hypothetical protein
MNFIERVRYSLGQGAVRLGRILDPSSRLTRVPLNAPVLLPAPQTPQNGGIVPAAEALSSYVPTSLDENDFKAGLWQGNQWSRIATFKIPEGVIYRLETGKPYRFYVKAVRRRNGIAAGAQVFNAPGLIQTKRVGVLPSYDHPEVVVWARVAGVWNQCEVTAINYASGDVTYTELAGTTQVEMWYLHNDGEWRLRLLRQLGGFDTSEQTMVNGAFAITHALDQNDAQTQPRFPGDYTITPGQTVALEVKTSIEVSWGEVYKAQPAMQFQALNRQVRALDKPRLAALAEVEARRGV